MWHELLFVATGSVLFWAGYWRGALVWKQKALAERGIKASCRELSRDLFLDSIALLDGLHSISILAGKEQPAYHENAEGRRKMLKQLEGQIQEAEKRGGWL